MYIHFQYRFLYSDRKFFLLNNNICFYQYKYYLSSSLPKEDTTNEFIYVISEDSNPTEELYSDFINNLKIPLYDFINKNYKNYLSKCRDGQKVIIKPIRYIKN